MAITEVAFSTEMPSNLLAKLKSSGTTGASPVPSTAYPARHSGHHGETSTMIIPLNATSDPTNISLKSPIIVRSRSAPKRQVSAQIGGRLLDVYKGLSVDVHEPQNLVNIDIRENGTTLVFGSFIKGADGMPVGSAGKGLLLISGGIDSPVAGHMIAKRGMSIECLHFHSYPYTNMQAKEKVIELAEVLSRYTCGTTLNIIKVTHIQEEIHKKCNGEYMVTLLRRFMMRIAEKIAIKCGAQCIITGESLGQVASQTIEGMTSSNAVIRTLPVLRPLCGFDKNEIIARSKAMGAYDISILPYEDCCTVFLPKHPVTKPKLSDVEAEEAKLDVEALVDEALGTLEIVKI